MSTDDDKKYRELISLGKIKLFILFQYIYCKISIFFKKLSMPIDALERVKFLIKVVNT